jgi:hypothetical protein
VSVGAARADRRLAMLWMALFAVSWAVLEEELGSRLRQPIPLTQIVWCRYASHLTLVVLIWGRRTPSQLWRTSRPTLQIGRSLLMLVMPLSFGAAVAFGGGLSAVWAAFWIAPLLILLFAAPITRERMPLWIWLVTAMACVGAVAVIAPSSAVRGWSLIGAGAMAGSFALYVVLTRVLRSEPLATNLFYTAFGVFVPLTLLMLRDWQMPSLHDAVILFAIGALGLLALFALDRAASTAPVWWSAPFLALQVATVSLVRWSGGEGGMGRAAPLGLLLIAAAVLATWLTGARSSDAGATEHGRRGAGRDQAS